MTSLLLIAAFFGSMALGIATAYLSASFRGKPTDEGSLYLAALFTALAVLLTVVGIAVEVGR